MTMGTDWDFIVALATTALVIASVVLLYMVVTYRRARTAAQKGLPASEADAESARADREPVFFRRYTLEE